ncbi:sugar phosphate nucleotidyltransferase, partial [Staphylococcus sp. 231237_7MaSpsaltlick]|uniref:sugar phosphate nucleotidyltransferase n=1 Tax=Staphylococcus sp. 231237_7MaSpsaltlick TaxID=3367518 RepID=UPI00370BC008
GIIDPKESYNELFSVNKFVEKPEIGTAPSNLAIMGRYVLKPDIFDYLESQEIGTGGEIQLTDAIEHLNSEDCVYAYNFEGERYDVGEKIGFVKTTIQFALNDDYMKKEITEFIKSINKLI